MIQFVFDNIETILIILFSIWILKYSWEAYNNSGIKEVVKYRVEEIMSPLKEEKK